MIIDKDKYVEMMAKNNIIDTQMVNFVNRNLYINTLKSI